MANDLILDSLEIRNFRGLRELRIARLGRVNLIVGKNNVGKSSVLEALRIYSDPGSIEVLLDVFESRDELRDEPIRNSKHRGESVFPIERLFYGRQAIPGQAPPISIGAIAQPDKTLEIKLDWMRQEYAKIDSNPEVGILEKEGGKLFVKRLALHFQSERYSSLVFLDNAMKQSRHHSTFLGTLPTGRQQRISLEFVASNGLDRSRIARLWDSISLTSLESEVIDSLRIISPEIQRLSLIAEGRDERSRMPVVKLENFDQPIPLRSMGDGISRLFGVVLALANAKNGLLLIDEIENGLHYSVQADVWRLIFKMAQTLNVQVFATSHSYDIINAFDLASRESQGGGVVIRLVRKGDRTLVGEFDENELAIAVEGQIEVR